MSGDIRWRCRRGMRELDAVLEYFLAHHHDDLTEALKIRFSAWLDLSDPILWDRLSGPLPEDAVDLELARRLRAFPGLLPGSS